MTSWTPNRSPLAAPHVHGRSNIPQVMRTVLLALLPATATGVFLFGWPALATVLLAIAGCVAAEAATDGLVSSSPINCGAPNSTLAAGATISCNANFTITNDIFAASALTSNATASGGGITSAAVVTTVTKQ